MNPLAGLERWFDWLLQTSGQAAVLALLILLAQFLLRRRLSPGWRHGLWLLLLVRLVLPITPTSPVSIFNLAKTPRAQLASPPGALRAPAALPGAAKLPVVSPADGPVGNDPAQLREKPARVLFAPQVGSEMRSQPTPAALEAFGPIVRGVATPARPLDYTGIAAWTWLAGAMTLTLRFVWCNQRFSRRLANHIPVRDDPFKRRFMECAELLGVRQRVVVVETDEVESPAVYGWWRKRLLLPEGLREELTAQELRHVLRHELAHIKRRDPELNCVITALQILHWFNPVLWLAFGRMRADRELATDDLALARTQARERRAYGETILKVLEGLSDRPALRGPLSGVVGIGESKAEIGERISAIAHGSVGARWRWAACLLTVVLASIALTSAREEQSTEGSLSRVTVAGAKARGTKYAMAVAENNTRPADVAAGAPDVDTNSASVVSVTPANGAQDVELVQELRIRFDRPMNPHNLKLKWVAGGFQPNGSIRVRADRTEFAIPVRLTPGQEQTLAVNEDPQRDIRARMGKKGKPERSPFAEGGFKDSSGVTANEFRWSFSTKAWAVKDDAPTPRVVSVSPPSGGAAPLLTFVEVTFDRAMRSAEYTFPYQEKRSFAMEGPSLIPSFEYDAKAHRFTIPALLRRDDDVRLTLRGFFSAEGVPCDPVVLHYQTGTENLDPTYAARAKAAAKDPNLQKLLASMREARARLNSGIETVQTIQLGMAKEAFNSIEAKTATFKWEGTGKVYADITGPMMTAGAFILGSDGVDCWLYSENEKGEKRLDKTPIGVTDQQVYLADPFDLERRSVEEVLAEDGLVLGGDGTLEGRRCYRVQRWEVTQQHFVSATQTQWWIDQETLLPKQIVSYSGNWCQIVRFDYTDLNQRLPDGAFQPPATANADAHPLFFDKEPAPGERRFLRVNDGSGGRMSGRLGWQGPGGTTSSGLN
jgi:beta-lactamase regulating signal transducer with metallopeptidase domain